MTSSPRRVKSACFAVIPCCILAFTFANRPGAYASSEDALHRGAMIFHSKGCERCHSITGVGGDRAPDLGSIGVRRGPRQIKTQILQGGHGMPPFEHVLSKDEVKDLVVFLTSCRTDTAPGCRDWGAPPSPQ